LRTILSHFPKVLTVAATSAALDTNKATLRIQNQNIDDPKKVRAHTM
jgi:hypothetical protein